MKIIGLLPVRNEAWVLEHSLASLSGFCDVIIVSDQQSSDSSRDICRRFPKVVLLDPDAADMEARLPQKARWRLLDAARSYEGDNVLWCTDADELTPPAAARSFFVRQAAAALPGPRHCLPLLPPLGEHGEVPGRSVDLRPAVQSGGVP